MLLNECPMCGCKEMTEIPELGIKCSNCDEIFKYDENYGIVPVQLEEWVEYLNNDLVRVNNFEKQGDIDYN